MGDENQIVDEEALSSYTEYLVIYERRTNKPLKPLLEGATTAILHLVAKTYGITPERLIASESVEAAGAYTVYCYMCKELTEASHLQIANSVQRQDHSVVSYAWKKIHDRMRKDQRYADGIGALKKLILMKANAHANPDMPQL